MKEHIIKKLAFDKVYLLDDNGKSVSWFTLVKENDRCFYDQLKWLLKPNGSVLYLSDFGTSLEYRRHGYGRRLLEYALKVYSNEIIYLGVKSCDEKYMTDDDLIKFYESVGFKKINYELPYQFMVYDKYGKISEDMLNEKIIKLTPTPPNEWGKLHVPNLPQVYIKQGDELIKQSMFIGMCALLKHRMHDGYCRLFLNHKYFDEESGVYSYRMQPLFDEHGNEILVKYGHDCLSVFTTYYGGDGGGWYDLEIDTNYGIG